MADLESLLAERQALLDRKFAGTLTNAERDRLDDVLDELDAIEMAGPMGRFLDALEAKVVEREKLVAEINAILSAARAA